MTERIIIEGNVVKHQDVKNLKVTKLDSVYDQIRQRLTVETPMMPMSTIYYGKKGTNQAVMFQDRPQMRDVILHHLDNSTDKMVDDTYRIWTPNVIYLWKNKDLYIFFARENNITKDTKLYRALLPNIYDGSNQVCLSPKQKEVIRKNLDKLPLMDLRMASTMFFTEKFNTDMIEGTKDFKIWQNSKPQKLKDEFFCDEHYVGTVKEMLTHVLGD